MRRLSIVAFGVLLGGLLLGYAVTYQVRFDEMVVLTTLGRADAGSVKNADGGGAGLYLKWPWPIQQVRRFDARTQILEDRLEQLETQDKQVLIATAYVAWRITDPLAFLIAVHSVPEAERYLLSRLRTARAEVGRFTFEELTSTSPRSLRLPEVEAAILARMRADLAGGRYGIAIETVGLRRIILPQDVAERVFERMSLTRQRLAQSARSEGAAMARSIRAHAESAEERILAFADRKAQDIRAAGDEAAARYYRIFAQNEDFAIFVRKLEALQATLANNTTFLLDTRIEPFDLLEEEGAGAEQAPAGESGRDGAPEGADEGD